MVILKIISYEVMPLPSGEKRFNEILKEPRTKRNIIKKAYLLSEDNEILKEYSERGFKDEC